MKRIQKDGGITLIALVITLNECSKRKLDETYLVLSTYKNKKYMQIKIDYMHIK